jgi:hypothetical protein
MKTQFIDAIIDITFQSLAPCNDEIRLGIQKCHKTIKDALRNNNIFHAEGTETLFLILRKTTELRSSEIGRYKYQGKGTDGQAGNVVGLHQILGMLKVIMWAIDIANNSRNTLTLIPCVKLNR